jgi:hypothetical protein
MVVLLDEIAALTNLDSIQFVITICLFLRDRADGAIDNMMDYTNDTCRTGFTPDQFARVKNQLAMLRGIQL